MLPIQLWYCREQSSMQNEYEFGADEARLLP